MICGCCLCLLFLSSCRQPNSFLQGTHAQVQRVISGQTIEVIINQSQPAIIERVRLMGITAPDLRQQPWGLAAKAQLENLLSGQQSQPSVILEEEYSHQDSYGRRWAYLWHNDRLVNEQLILAGYALVNSDATQDKYTQRLLHAQEYARLMGLGVWNPQEPMSLTPQEFRNQN